MDADLLETWRQIAFVVVAMLNRVPYLDPIDTTFIFPIARTLPFNQKPRIVLRWLAKAEKALLPLFFRVFYPALDVKLRDVIAR